MDIRPLTPTYSVSPQIAATDVADLKAAGYQTVICNRPDAEIPADFQAATVGAMAEAAGLTFVYNPIIGGALTMANVEAQRAAIDAAKGPVFAYCASGNRSSIVWAMANAARLPIDDLIGLPAQFGYQLAGLRPQLEMLKAQQA
jgi:uncharacterized protein (TIGR01244 family)